MYIHMIFYKKFVNSNNESLKLGSVLQSQTKRHIKLQGKYFLVNFHIRSTRFLFKLNGS